MNTNTINNQPAPVAVAPATSGDTWAVVLGAHGYIELLAQLETKEAIVVNCRSWNAQVQDLFEIHPDKACFIGDQLKKAAIIKVRGTLNEETRQVEWIMLALRVTAFIPVKDRVTPAIQRLIDEISDILCEKRDPELMPRIADIMQQIVHIDPGIEIAPAAVEAARNRRPKTGDEWDAEVLAFDLWVNTFSGVAVTLRDTTWPE